MFYKKYFGEIVISRRRNNNVKREVGGTILFLSAFKDVKMEKNVFYFLNEKGSLLHFIKLLLLVVVRKSVTRPILRIILLLFFSLLRRKN